MGSNLNRQILPLERKTAITGLVIFCCALCVSTAAAENGSNEGARESAAQLDTVVVTGSLDAIRLEQAPSGYSEVGRAAIERRPVTSLDGILRGLPGIDVRQERGGGGVPRIRGLDSEHTTVLVNGRRIANTDRLFPHANFRMGQVPPAAIERVEVVRSPTSSVYGADALGGAINIITRPPAHQWTGAIGSRYGTLESGRGGEEMNHSLFVGGPLSQRVRAMAALEHTDIQATRDPERPQADATEARTALSGYSSLFLDPIPNQQVELFYNAVCEERLYEDLMDIDRELFQYTAGITHEYFGAAWETQVHLYRSESRSEELNLERKDHYREEVVQAKASYAWHDNHRITVGTDYRQERYRRDRNGRPDLSQRTAEHRGAMLENRSHWFDERLTVNLGVRADNPSNYASQITSRAASVLAITPSTQIKAEYAEGFTAPDLRRSHPDYVFTHPPSDGSVVRHGNPDLEPETISSVSAGIDYQDGPRYASATYFHNEIDNLIEARPADGMASPPYDDPIWERWEYQNISQAVTKGFELEGGWNTESGHRIRANYTYLSTEDCERNAPLMRRPEYTASLLAETVPWPGGALSLRAEWKGSQAFGDRTLSGYELFHLGASQTVGDRFVIRGGVENIEDMRLRELDPDYPFEHRGRFYHLSANWQW